MKKTILLASFLTSILAYSQEKVNNAELKRIATQEEQALEDAKANVTTNIFEHTYPEGVSFQGMTAEGTPVFYASDSRPQILSMDVDDLHNGTIPGVTATGEGFTAYIWDGGLVRLTHREFEGRATNVETTGSNSFHATGVGAVIIAGGLNPNAQGMAYEANLKALNFTVGSTVGEISNQSSQPENQNYMISNHSYGSLCGWYFNEAQNSWYWYGYPHISETESVLFGYYSQQDASYDNVALNAPQHTLFKSSGNNNTEGPNSAVNHFAFGPGGNWVEHTNVSRPKDCASGGYDCLSYGGSNTKNIIVVGSINPIGGTNEYTGPEDVVNAWYSSSGPTDDGRIKPDITAIGSNVFTANNTSDTSYASFSGTSFSAPAAAGVGLLLQQVKNQKDGGYLRSDMMKALLLNTANEAGEHIGPDYKFGFGLVDALKAAQTIVNVNEDSFTADLVLADGGSYTRSFQAKGGEPIKATIAWLDIAGTATSMVLNDRTPKLVNDLDFRIESNGTTYMPWTLNPDSPASAAVPADNVVDNVEQILVENPVAGQTYTFTVTHKGNLVNNNQNFALVVNGVDHVMATTDVDLNKAISVYPNPVLDNLNIKINQNLTNVKVTIFNAMGQVAYNNDFKTMSANQSIDMKSFAPGTYMVFIKSDEGTVTKKVIKK